MIASQALFNSYLQGKEICSKDPVQRTEEELIILEQWLLERSSLFKTTTKGTLLLTIKVMFTPSNSYRWFPQSLQARVTYSVQTRPGDISARGCCSVVSCTHSHFAYN